MQDAIDSAHRQHRRRVHDTEFIKRLLVIIMCLTAAVAAAVAAIIVLTLASRR